MNKSESKYYNTACLMDEAFILLLDKKEFKYITAKEVCVKAGVNRSTFYLHYESMSDLLEESFQYVLDKFNTKMKEAGNGQLSKENNAVEKQIKEADIDELYLVTPKYLTPYLQFIEENKRIYAAMMNNIGLFDWKSVYGYIFNSIVSPVCERFGQKDEAIKKYVFSFYIRGLSAIVEEWLKRDCKESVEEVISIIERCMNR